MQGTRVLDLITETVCKRKSLQKLRSALLEKQLTSTDELQHEKVFQLYRGNG